jgi:hypothetical protein
MTTKIFHLPRYTAMQFKRCFKCQVEKPLEAFYKHSRMGDGHLNKCKDCARKDTIANRLAKADKYREYDRLRASMPHRVSARREYAKTSGGKQAHRKALKRYSDRYPDRRIAHYLLGNAVRDGRIKPLPCFVCGEKAEAHHPAYSQPLDVVWLCNQHHRQAHKATRMAA